MINPLLPDLPLHPELENSLTPMLMYSTTQQEFIFTNDFHNISPEWLSVPRDEVIEFFVSHKNKENKRNIIDYLIERIDEIMLSKLFYIAALICFGLAAFGVNSRVGLIPAGLFFLTLAIGFF